METTTEQSLFSPGKIIAGRYEVLNAVGKGGMGIVLRVVDRALDNEVTALKLLYPHMAQDKTQFARFRNEVLLARKLAHPNIVRLYDFGNAGGGYYFISMEYVDGSSLAQRIYSPRHEQLTFPESLHILYEICQGLGCAHRKGVVHRDLKPDNILIGRDGEVKITDFGLARSLVVEKGLTDTGDTVGTPFYMAPEQLSGQRPDCRVDIYSLGILAFEMVVGRKPFIDDNYLTLATKHFKQEIPDFATKESGIPRWYERFVQTCAAKRREDRYDSVEEVAEILLEHMDDRLNESVRRLPAVLSFYAPTKKTRRQTVSLFRSIGMILVVALALVGLVLGPLTLIRSWEGPRQQVGSMLLKSEQKLGVRFSLLRAMMEIGVDSEDFFAAVMSGDVKTVRTLLEAKRKPDDKDHLGNPALVLALLAEKPSLEVIKLLLEHQAEPNKTDAQGQSALMHAARRGNTEAMRMLLDQGAEINMRDAERRTALVHAVLENQMPAVDLLFERQAGINIADKDGNTPLIHAVREHRPEMIRAFLEHKANVDLVNNQGKKAIDFAARAEKRLFREYAERVPPVVTSRPTAITRGSGGESPVQQTRLRVQGKPESLIHHKQVTSNNAVPAIYHIKVSVKNVGRAAARGIQVAAVTPGGKRVVLMGPTELKGYKKAVYENKVEPSEPVTGEPEIKTEVSCSNCRR